MPDMTIKQAARKSREKRWEKIAKAESIEEMRKLESGSSCLFCLMGVICSECPCEKLCDNEYDVWCDALAEYDFPAARIAAEAICERLEEIERSEICG